MGNYIDITGKKFGKLTAIKRVPDHITNKGNKITMWECQCECGNIKNISRSSLVSGYTKSCGCLQKEMGKQRRMNPELMIGRKIGKLTVVREVPIEESPQNRYGYFYCDCDCGTKNYMVKGTNLRRKKRPTQSCGCLNSEMSHKKNTIDITGQKYGHLTVIKEHNGETSPGGSVLWDCICDCGNSAIVSSNALRTGDTISCGCVASKNEERIQKVLEKYNIPFKSQYTFDDLRSPLTNWLLKFDFALFNKDDTLNCIIEYDGEQHEYGTRFSSNPEKNKIKFDRIMYYDYLKNKYCITNHIPLIRISYREKDILEQKVEQILTRRELVNGIC